MVLLPATAVPPPERRTGLAVCAHTVTFDDGDEAAHAVSLLLTCSTQLGLDGCEGGRLACAALGDAREGLEGSRCKTGADPPL